MHTQTSATGDERLSARAAQSNPQDHARARGLDLDQIRAHVEVLRHRLDAGDYLYRAGQPFRSIFMVRVGSLKTCELAEDGREQVTGFRMNGEMIGVESIGLKVYACDVIALESCEVWELPYPPVLTACLHLPELQASLTEAMAAEIRRDRQWMLALGTLTAEQRVAAFLLDTAARYAALGFSGSDFNLRMSRADMASYLAIKHETVSRALAQLSDASCIDVQRRALRILDQAALRRIAGYATRLH